MLADQVDAVIGVDTHHDTHTPSVVTPLGAEPAHLQLDALSAADCLKVYMTRLSSTRPNACTTPARSPWPRSPYLAASPPMTIYRHIRTGPALDHVTHQGCLLSVAR